MMAGRRMRRPLPKDPSRHRLWVYLALAAFVAVDIALIQLALTATHPTTVDSSATPGSPLLSIAPSTSTSASSPPTPVASASQPASGVVPPPSRILTALNATTAWRALTGPCPATAASPELTTDSGSHWKVTDVTGPTKVTALQRIIVPSARQALMVGLSQTGCTPELVRTFVAGDNYAVYPNDLPGAWFVDPANRASVHSPAGSFAAPCAAIIAVAPQDAKVAAVLCADDQVFVTTDAAAHWSQPVTVAGAVNLTVSASGYLAAAIGQKGCAGVQIVALSAALAMGHGGCYPTTVSPLSLSDGVAISDAGNTLWLWAGNAIVRSSDGGTTWQ